MAEKRGSAVFDAPPSLMNNALMSLIPLFFPVAKNLLFNSGKKMIFQSLLANWGFKFLAPLIPQRVMRFLS